MSADSDLDEIASALNQEGAVVVTGLLDKTQRETVRSELAPFMAESRVLDEDDPSDFFPSKTYDDIVLGKKAKIITSIAMFYDLPNPLDFAQQIYNILHQQGVWHQRHRCCSVPKTTSVA